MNIFEFWQWWWDAYFKHLEAIEIISMRNLVNTLSDQVKTMDRRLIGQGI